MLMKKKKKKSPSLGVLVALPLLALGACLLMKKKGCAMLRGAKRCCSATEKAIDEMMN